MQKQTKHSLILSVISLSDFEVSDTVLARKEG